MLAPSGCPSRVLGVGALLLPPLLLPLPPASIIQRRLRLLLTTAMLLRAIMPPAREGLSATPYAGSSAPAATGTPTKLYATAGGGVWERGHSQ